jgi:2-dehydro-3-deoxyphosphooctonate aldolase (KDO 8-P synthase)
MNISIPDFQYSDKQNFFLISGPCVVENEAVVFDIASTLKEMCAQLKIPFIFKASYRKANRSSLHSFTGIGDEKALSILAKIKADLKVPVLTDIHSPEEAIMAADFVDILQIPAFLCRQTELLLAAGNTGKPVNIKKGQFMSPESMHFAVEKLKSTGNSNIWLTERGSFFGYQDLIVDFRSVVTMRKYGPCVVDCTHALQKPNQATGVTGGNPELISTLAKASIAVGADGLFIETHPDPGTALSDGANMLPLSEMKDLLLTCRKIRNALI